MKFTGFGVAGRAVGNMHEKSENLGKGFKMFQSVGPKDKWDGFSKNKLVCDTVISFHSVQKKVRKVIAR